MCIVRSLKNRENPYVQIDKRMLEDPNLSLKSKGLIAYCLSKPDDWTFYINQLITVLKEGKDAIYATFMECVEMGYAIRRVLRDDKGRISKHEVIVSDSKEEIEKIKHDLEVNDDLEKVIKMRAIQKGESPLTENPVLDYPVMENPPLTIKNDNNILTSVHKEKNDKCDNNIAKEEAPDGASQPSHPSASFEQREESLIASFDPGIYRLRDGKRLSLRMQSSLAKYKETSPERLLRNLIFYEEQMDKDVKVKTTHEQYLQFCLNKDLGARSQNVEKNLMFAEVIKSENPDVDIRIKKTCVQIDGNDPISLSLELDPEEFGQRLKIYVDHDRRKQNIMNGV